MAIVKEDQKYTVLDESKDPVEQNEEQVEELQYPEKGSVIIYPGQVPLEERSKERDPLPAGWTQEKHEDKLLYTYDENNIPVCGAWNPRRRKYCKGKPMIGKNRCEFHGGKSLRGIQAPALIHGGYSRDLNQQLAHRFRESRNNTELLSLRDDIALVDASIGERLSSMHDGEAAELWVRAKKTYKALLAALKRQDDIESTALMTELGSILGHGADNVLAMREVHKKQDLKKKLIETEQKRLVAMRQMVTIEELMLVVGALVDSLKKHVHDTQALSYVSADLRKLLQDRGYADKKS